MAAGHGQLLLHPGDSLVHRLPAHLKVLALLGFVIAVVATPRQAVWAFAAHLTLLLGVIGISTVPLRHLLPRMVVELPFVVFALVLPFVATGQQVALGPWQVSADGLWGAWALLAKGSLGVLASLVLASTTPARDLVGALHRLRVPELLVQILSFMLRYLDVVGGELHRMRVARASRGFRARSLRAWPVLARSTGALFIRSYERGERVHLAMLSRGYAGSLPMTDRAGPGAGAGWPAATLPAAAATVLAVALLW